mmetsp:Transcript_31299/g.66461  ORF Transcript_31299/g.66461 Transcript_31299/m.66461 type:complete len:240 (-) Transcript_31299:633-1352(-)
MRCYVRSFFSCGEFLAEPVLCPGIRSLSGRSESQGFTAKKSPSSSPSSSLQPVARLMKTRATVVARECFDSSETSSFAKSFAVGPDPWRTGRMHSKVFPDIKHASNRSVACAAVGSDPETSPTLEDSVTLTMGASSPLIAMAESLASWKSAFFNKSFAAKGKLRDVPKALPPLRTANKRRSGSSCSAPLANSRAFPFCFTAARTSSLSSRSCLPAHRKASCPLNFAASSMNSASPRSSL